MAPALDFSGTSAARRSANSGNRKLPLRGKREPEEEKKLNACRRPLVLRNRLTALVADGSTFCRMVEKALLQHFGVETETVDNGQAAIDLLASGARFNFILIDLILPVVNGLETARQIRAMGIRTKMFGIAASSYDSDMRDFLAAGVDEYIEKPLDPDRLATILLELDAQ